MDYGVVFGKKLALLFELYDYIPILDEDALNKECCRFPTKEVLHRYVNGQLAGIVGNDLMWEEYLFSHLIERVRKGDYGYSNDLLFFSTTASKQQCNAFRKELKRIIKYNYTRRADHLCRNSIRDFLLEHEDPDMFPLELIFKRN